MLPNLPRRVRDGPDDVVILPLETSASHVGRISQFQGFPAFYGRTPADERAGWAKQLREIHNHR